MREIETIPPRTRRPRASRTVTTMPKRNVSFVLLVSERTRVIFSPTACVADTHAVAPRPPDVALPCDPPVDRVLPLVEPLPDAPPVDEPEPASQLRSLI